MGLLAAHLNDASITVVNDDKILYREPGFALLEDEHLVVGTKAHQNARLHPRRIQNHYWTNLTLEPLGDRRFLHLSAADLVSRQLEGIWRAVAAPGDRLAIAVPAYMSTENLGLLLGIAEELKIPLVAMMDAAVSATRREYQNAVPVHIDVSLFSTQLTRLSQDGRVQVDRHAVIDEAGLLILYDIWLKLIADVFVQQSRFDPLHTAETEQVLQDQLPNLLAAAAKKDVVEIKVEYAGITHEAEIESLVLVAAASPVYQSIVSRLRALYRAEELPAVQLSDRAAALPGLAQTLQARVGGQVFLLEPGATARGLQKRCREQQVSGGLTLARHLPWDQSPTAVEVEGDNISGGMPTHILFGNDAYSLNGAPLVLGSQILDGERCLDLREDMPGVSRRHCVLSTDNNQLVVTDHSRYGTYLNGHRIDGSAVLQTGDLIRIGTPGFELRLIHAVDAHGT